LQALDTAAICDADKGMFAKVDNYKGIKLLNFSIRPVNPAGMHQTNAVMVGTAKTVQCTQRNDFLAVLRGLMEAQAGDVLMVDSCGSDRAVAGELFCLQALQRGISGIVVDGPVRDTIHIQQRPEVSSHTKIRIYSTSITPYSGTIQSPGSTNVPIQCGGVRIESNDIIIGDNDGVLAADAETLQQLLPDAQAIFDLESKVKSRLLKGDSLADMSNLERHIAARLEGTQSSLVFKV